MFLTIQDVSWHRQLLIAISLVAVVTGLQLVLSIFIGVRAPFLFFMPTVALASALFGRLAAITVLGSGALYGVFILDPTHVFWVDAPADRIAILVFMAVGVLFCYLGDMVRKISHRARVAELALSEARLKREVDTLTVFQEMFDQAPGFMTVLHGPDHVYVMENQSHRNFHGDRAIIGLPVRDAFPELDGQGILEILDDVYASGVTRTAYEVPLLLHRRSQELADQLYMDFVCQPLRDDHGQVSGLFVEGFDVTPQKEMRDALRESHMRLQQGLAAARMTFWTWDMASDQVEFADNAGAVLQAGAGELAASWHIIDAEERPKLARLRATVLAGSTSGVQVVRRTPPGQAPLWLELRATAVADGDGALTHLRGVAIDVSLQKKAELLVAEHETQRRSAVAKAETAHQRLQLAVDAAGLGVFYCPLPLEHIYWNDTCKAQFFLPPEAKVDVELFYRMIAPEDRARVTAAVQRAVEAQSGYDVEYRTVAPDGRTRWIRAKGRVYCDEGGVPVRFDGITIDIQQQKEAEAALQAANQQKDDFLAMLAHELRNPLAPISSASSVLLKRKHGDEEVRYLSQVISPPSQTHGRVAGRLARRVACYARKDPPGVRAG